MKKALATLFAIFVVLVLETSCDMPMDEKGPSSDPEPVYTKEYILPDFAVVSGTQARGLMEMPEWGEPGRSAGVMQTLPALIGLKEVKRNNFDEVIADAESEGEIEVLGFTLSPDIKAWRENEDGFFLKYDLVAAGRRVGFVQYYYSFREKVFSYRQMLVATFMDPTSPQSFILALEYSDLPVRNHEQIGRFSFGQLDEKGATDRNAFVDRIGLNNDGTVSFTRSYLSGVSGKDIYASVLRPDMSFGTGDFTNEDITGAINSLGSSNNHNDCIDTVEGAQAAGLGFIYNVIPAFYANAEAIRNADGKHTPFEPYQSYEEYKAATLSAVSIKGHEPERSKAAKYDGLCVNPVAYKWTDSADNVEAASATIMNDLGLSQGAFLDISELNWEKSGFGSFYDIDLNNISADELRRELISQHLKQCGLENENFIENFTYAALDEAYGRSTYWPYGITTDDHEVFKRYFEENRTSTSIEF